MSDTLATSIIAKAPKITEPSVKSEAASTPVQPGPPNFDLNAMDLFPIEDNDDDILINFINANPNLENSLLPVQQQRDIPSPPVPAPQQADMNIQKSIQNVQNVQSYAANLPSVIPKMYFPGSNITINYNFHSK